LHRWKHVFPFLLSADPISDVNERVHEEMKALGRTWPARAAFMAEIAHQFEMLAWMTEAIMAAYAT